MYLGLLGAQTRDLDVGEKAWEEGGVGFEGLLEGNNNAREGVLLNRRGGLHYTNSFSFYAQKSLKLRVERDVARKLNRQRGGG